MEPAYYSERWELGYELMKHFEFVQSEGTECIFALLKGIQVKYNLSNEEIIALFKKL